MILSLFLFCSLERKKFTRLCSTKTMLVVNFTVFVNVHKDIMRWLFTSNLSLSTKICARAYAITLSSIFSGNILSDSLTFISCWFKCRVISYMVWLSCAWEGLILFNILLKNLLIKKKKKLLLKNLNIFLIDLVYILRVGILIKWG